jgi:predicted secreted protein
VADVPEELRLRVGEENTIRLPGLATAGYRWQAAVENENVASVSSRFDSDETPDARHPASSRDELVTVSGRAEGTTHLSLIQRRPWEGGGDPIARHDVVVTVVAAAAQQPDSGGRHK